MLGESGSHGISRASSLGARRYTELEVWKNANDLRDQVNRLVNLPEFSQHAWLHTELRRAAQAACAGIADGFGRQPREFAPLRAGIANCSRRGSRSPRTSGASEARDGTESGRTRFAGRQRRPLSGEPDSGFRTLRRLTLEVRTPKFALLTSDLPYLSHPSAASSFAGWPLNCRSAAFAANHANASPCQPNATAKK